MFQLSISFQKFQGPMFSISLLNPLKKKNDNRVEQNN